MMSNLLRRTSHGNSSRHPHVLWTNQAQLAEHVAKDMGAAKAQQFADELHALQSTWQQNLAEDTVLSMTLEQMKGYPPVWDDIQKAGLTAATPPATVAQPSQASPSPQPAAQPAAPAATKPAQPAQSTAQPAQAAPQNQSTATSSGKPASSGDQTMQQEPLPTSTKRTFGHLGQEGLPSGKNRHRDAWAS